MAKLLDYAQIIRSKNSGPFNLTLDVIFKDKEAYDTIKNGGQLNKAAIAKLYKIEEKDVLIFLWFDAARAVKATIVRHMGSGSLHETDVYGAQQHAPLLDLPLDL